MDEEAGGGVSHVNGNSSLPAGGGGDGRGRHQRKDGYELCFDADREEGDKCSGADDFSCFVSVAVSSALD